MNTDPIIDSLYPFLWQNPMVNNCNTYFIAGDKNILIDPGHYNLLGHVKDRLASFALSLADIDVVLITHGHPDHMEGLKAFLDNQTIWAIHAREMEFIREFSKHYGETLGFSNLEPKILLEEGDLTIGDLRFQVIHTPGHSPGSACIYWPEKKALFSGDLVFSQGVGRTDLPGGNGGALKESIKKISSLDVEHLLPGHGEIVSGKRDVDSNYELIKTQFFALI